MSALNTKCELISLEKKRRKKRRSKLKWQEGDGNSLMSFNYIMATGQLAVITRLMEHGCSRRKNWRKTKRFCSLHREICFISARNRILLVESQAHRTKNELE